MFMQPVPPPADIKRGLGRGLHTIQLFLLCSKSLVISPSFSSPSSLAPSLCLTLLSRGIKKIKSVGVPMPVMLGGNKSLKSKGVTERAKQWEEVEKWGNKGAAERQGGFTGSGKDFGLMC